MGEFGVIKDADKLLESSGVDKESKSRREFIEKCGRLALITPPTISMMLAAEGRIYQAAASGGNTGRQERQESRQERRESRQERRGT